MDNDNVPWCYTSDKYRRWDYCDLQITQGSVCLSVCLSAEEAKTTAEIWTMIMFSGVIPVINKEAGTTATFR